MLSLLGVTWNHDNRYLSLHVLLPTCVQLLHAAHIFDVSVLYVHVVFDDKHAMHLGGGGGGGGYPNLANLYIYIF